MRFRISARVFLTLTVLAAVTGQLSGCAAMVRPRPPVGPPEVADFVVARDGHLYLDGRRFRFVGVNVYSLASFPPNSGKYYCGLAHSDRDVADIMGEVAAMGGNVIRLSVYQAFTEGGTDFSRLDFVIAEAKRHGLRLILTLENQWADCTAGGYKYADWYCDGYRQPYGSYRLSFVECVRLIVGRYREEPTVLMWQLMNEAESRNAWWMAEPEPLRAFAVEMSALIKSLDRRHPVSLGTGEVTRPGSGGGNYCALAGLAGLDVIEAHDYGDERQAWPPAIAWANGIGALVGKPFFIGEVGISSPPFSRQERAELIRAKMEAAWDAGVEGILVWSYRAGDGTNKDFDARDPLAAAIRLFISTHAVR